MFSLNPVPIFVVIYFFFVFLVFFISSLFLFLRCYLFLSLFISNFPHGCHIIQNYLNVINIWFGCLGMILIAVCFFLCIICSFVLLTSCSIPLQLYRADKCHCFPSWKDEILDSFLPHQINKAFSGDCIPDSEVIELAVIDSIYSTTEA